MGLTYHETAELSKYPKSKGEIRSELVELIRANCDTLGVRMPSVSVQFRHYKRAPWHTRAHYVPSKKYIYIGAGSDLEHARFAALHELCHYVSHLVAEEVGVNIFDMSMHGETFYAIAAKMYERNGLNMNTLIRARWEYAVAKTYCRTA